MKTQEIPGTRLTLLGRLVDATDQEAWREFVLRYGETLRRWCKRWNLSDVDADDVVQNILLELSTHIRNFRPTGRFRGWLKTVAKRAWYDYTQRRLALDRAVGGADVLQLLQSDAAMRDFADQLDAEANRELMELAMQVVQTKVTPSAWEAFRLSTLEALSGAEVSQRTNMSVGSVYVSTCRVRKLLQTELLRLQNGEQHAE